MATTTDTEKKKLGKEEEAYKERAKRARQVADASTTVVIHASSTPLRL